MLGISRGAVSSLSQPLGVVSILVWLCAQIPQVLKNHKKKCVAGISPGFLFAWIVGDVSGLLGCIITKQLMFQTLLACYYCSIDVILLAQYLAYRETGTIEYLDGCAVDNSNHPRRTSKGSIKDGILAALKVSSVASSLPGVSAAPIFPSDVLAEHAHSHSSSNVLLIGRLFGYLSTTMYLVSRLPQIYHNFQRKSTTGMSMLLFASAFVGNLTYAASILLSPDCIGENAHTRQFLWNELSYLVGSIGTMLFDLFILVQWRYYKANMHLRRRPTAFLDKLSRPYFALAGGSSPDCAIHSEAMDIPVGSSHAPFEGEYVHLLPGSPASYGSLASSSCISSISSL